MLLTLTLNIDYLVVLPTFIVSGDISDCELVRTSSELSANFAPGIVTILHMDLCALLNLHIFIKALQVEMGYNFIVVKNI